MNPVEKIMGKKIKKIVRDKYGRNKEVHIGDEYDGRCPSCGAFVNDFKQSGYGVGYFRCSNKNCSHHNDVLFYERDSKISKILKQEEIK